MPVTWTIRNQPRAECYAFSGDMCTTCRNFHGWTAFHLSCWISAGIMVFFRMRSHGRESWSSARTSTCFRMTVDPMNIQVLAPRVEANQPRKLLDIFKVGRSYNEVCWFVWSSRRTRDWNLGKQFERHHTVRVYPRRLLVQCGQKKCGQHRSINSV